jgi:hypothetical protein
MKGESKMERGELAKKGLYAGTGAGLILFVLVGFFPGSLIGGAAGLYISNLLMGGAIESSLIPRMIIAISMVAGVLGSAAVFVIGSSVAGWATGSVIEALQGHGAAEQEEARQTASN